MSDSVTKSNSTSPSPWGIPASDPSYSTTNPYDSEGYYSDLYADDPLYPTEPSGWGTPISDAMLGDPWNTVQELDTLASASGVEASAQPSTENAPTVIDNATDPVIAHQGLENGVFQTIVYLPIGYDDSHGATFTGIPMSATVVAEPGSEENTVLLKIYDADGKLIAEHTVHVDSEKSWLKIEGGASIDTSALQGTAYEEMIYFNKPIPVEHESVTVIEGTTQSLGVEELQHEDSYTFYTSGENVNYDFTAEQGSSYTVKSTKGSDGKYDLVLTFTDADGEVLSTVTLYDVDGTTDIAVNGATLKGGITDNTLQIVFGLVEDPEDVNGDGNVDDWDEIAEEEEVDEVENEESEDVEQEAASKAVNDVAHAVGKTPAQLLEIYEYSEYAIDMNSDGKIGDMGDLNAFLASFDRPKNQLLGFLELIDPNLALIRADIDSLATTSHSIDHDFATNGEVGDEMMTVTMATQAMQDLEADYRNRMVELLEKVFPGQVEKRSGKVSHTVKDYDNDFLGTNDTWELEGDAHPGDVKDDIVFTTQGGTKIVFDLIDFMTGSIAVQTATDQIDFDWTDNGKVEETITTTNPDK